MWNLPERVQSREADTHGHVRLWRSSKSPLTPWRRWGLRAEGSHPASLQARVASQLGVDAGTAKPVISLLHEPTVPTHSRGKPQGLFTSAPGQASCLHWGWARSERQPRQDTVSGSRPRRHADAASSDGNGYCHAQEILQGTWAQVPPSLS